MHSVGVDSCAPGGAWGSVHSGGLGSSRQAIRLLRFRGQGCNGSADRCRNGGVGLERFASCFFYSIQHLLPLVALPRVLLVLPAVDVGMPFCVRTRPAEADVSTGTNVRITAHSQLPSSFVKNVVRIQCYSAVVKRKPLTQEPNLDILKKSKKRCLRLNGVGTRHECPAKVGGSE